MLERIGTGRLNQAACPFPGKYPLRLYCEFTDRQGREQRYHGKFCAPVWRWICTQYGVSGCFRLYDKAGTILYGTVPLVQQHRTSSLSYRYFGRTGWNSEFLKGVVPSKIGPYWMYLNDPHLDRSGWLRYVNTSVAHVRTV